jgi:aryl-alcohol dehydrogenase-like predicted oxidoreductase
MVYFLKGKFNMLELGLGTIGIGREWGGKPPCSGSESQELLAFAVDNGIKFIDTAPAYGDSERRLGMFLDTLDSEKRNSLTIATKFGEYWSADQGAGHKDHSYDTMARGLDNSLNHLSKIDVLQLHQPSVDVLKSEDFSKFYNYAKFNMGISKIGISFGGGVDVAQFILQEQIFDFNTFQFPFNAENQTYKFLLEALENKKDILPIVNRPFNTGKATELGFKAVKENLEQYTENGVILTGTRQVKNLESNIIAFYK